MFKLAVRSHQISTFFRQWQSVQVLRLFHDEFTHPDPVKKPNSELKIGPSSQPKYKPFRDEDASIIFDVEEERLKMQQESAEEITDAYADLNMKRGIHGVFDIEDLVNTLQRENAINIFVCKVPKDLKYVDYMCIVTGRSYRHMLAIAEFVRRVYKMKRTSGDILPKIEGEKCRDWLALDLGNIALHIFSANARELYDLESLWSLGPEFDRESNKPEDPLLKLFEKNIMFLRDLQPKQANSTPHVDTKSS